MSLVGSPLPSVTLFEGSPKDGVNIKDLFGDKKGVLFAVPGAFTPGCSKTHLPGYLGKWDEMKEKGVEIVACVAVNDPFVMAAWGASAGVENKIRMLADPLAGRLLSNSTESAEFTKAIGMEISLPPLGGIRSKRYAILVEGGVVKAMYVEPDGTGLSCSLASNLMASL